MFGTYAYKVIPFGMTNAPPYWQRILDHVLRARNNTNVFVYLDNIMIATETRKEHADVLEWVFDRLTTFGLRGKFKKYEFYQQKISYLD
jgi:Reverse transcriptase (RNA-dependent DNA polymerase)